MKKGEITEKLKKKLGRLAGFAIWILIIILFLSLIKNLGGASRIRADIATEEARVRKMQEDNENLAQEVAQAQSRVFVEKQIRDKLGLVKEGEAIVVLPDEETLRILAPKNTTEEDALPDPNWKKWLKLFI